MIGTRIAGPLIILIIAMSTHSASGLQLNQNQDDVSIILNLDYIFTKTGDEFQFDSTITNNGDEISSKLIVAMNIVNLEDGAPVDPEDWSPQRTQFINPLGNGLSRTLTWTVYTILKGDYAVYLVVIPIPEAEEETSLPISSSAIHVTVNEFSRLNPQGILPFVVGIPILLIVCFVMIRRRRNRMLTD